MGHRAKFVARDKLYELVWSTPVSRLAAEMRVAAPTLTAACHANGIPLPGRGYWARLRAGKRVEKRPLAPRVPGGAEIISLGGYYWQAGFPPEPGEPLPPPPDYPESIDELAARMKRLVGKVGKPRSMGEPHPCLRKLLSEDAKREAQNRRTGFNILKPLYDSAEERRRLRLVNAIFLTARRVGCSPIEPRTEHDKPPDEFGVTVGQQHVAFTLVGLSAKGRKPGRPTTRLRLAIRGRSSSIPTLASWEDREGVRLEDLIAEIVVALVVAGEKFHRDNVQAHYDWFVGQRAEAEAEARRRAAEAERQAKEAVERERQARVAELLEEADAFRQAATIRDYVAVVLKRAGDARTEELERWATSALGEAERLDPIRRRLTQHPPDGGR